MQLPENKGREQIPPESTKKQLRGMAEVAHRIIGESAQRGAGRAAERGAGRMAQRITGTLGGSQRGTALPTVNLITLRE